MKTPPPKELLRFALADHAFREADSLAEHILATSIPVTSHLYMACVAGVVVSYVRPFVSAEGLGPLPATMADFAKTEDEQFFKDAHETLVEARHKIVAHFDREHAEAEFKSGKTKIPPGEVTIELQQRGCIIGSTATFLTRGQIERSRRLFELQIRRVSEHLGTIGERLFVEHGPSKTFTYTA